MYMQIHLYDQETLMTQHPRSDAAALILRLGLGVMYLAHSLVLKLATFGLHGTAEFFAGVGLPRWLAYLTFAAEALGGTLLVLGIWSRRVALGLLPALVGAIVWVHAANGWVFTAPNGGWEYPAFLILASIAVALLGDGSYALAGREAHRPQALSPG
jgi:putative oxidoreductase